MMSHSPIQTIEERLCGHSSHGHRGSFARAAAALVMSAALFGATAHAQSARREALLILRVLSYDSQLPSRVRSAEDVTVLVVYKGDDSDSESTKNQITRSINSLSARMTVAGKRPRAVAHAYVNSGTLQEAIRRAGAAALYVAPGLTSEIAAISAATRAAHILSLTPVESYVRNGLSVGFIASSGRTGLLVNLPASRAEQARLDAALLRLATVIR